MKLNACGPLDRRCEDLAQLGAASSQFGKWRRISCSGSWTADVSRLVDHTKETLLFEQHAATCKGCGRYLDQMRRTIEIAGQLTPESMPPEAEAALLNAFRDWKSR